ncbi:hypothetical protein EKD04_025720 [Chloroflexales bacterium ZM16-3]|nr:hypothetical protein [Chloroflexales bacterium ZM16-3]
MLLVERLAGGLMLADRLFKRPRVPERDRRDNQVQPARSLLEILDRVWWTPLSRHQFGPFSVWVPPVTREND